MLAELPETVTRVLDLGSGAGRLLGMVLEARPDATGVAVDFSPPFLEELRKRFGASDRVRTVEYDMTNPLPELGKFEVVVSGFAIHHLEHERKRELYQEVWERLETPGIFCNLEHVASPSDAAHERFLSAISITAEEEDQSNILLNVETQLRWLREIGFAEVDCYWKWRELALMVGRKL